MILVFFSHEPEASENFYDERAQAESNEVAKGRINDSGPVLSTDMLVGGARGCDLVVSSVTGLRPGLVPKWIDRSRRSAYFLRKGRA